MSLPPCRSKFLSPAAVGVSISEAGTTLVSATGAFVNTDEWTEISFTVCSGTATLRIDGVAVLSASVTSTDAASIGLEGTVGSMTTNTLTVSDVRVTQLRYDGTELTDVVSETFADGIGDWTEDATDTAWTWGATTHHVLDLSFLDDLLLQIDYTGALRFPA